MITKTHYLAFSQCPKAFWLDLHSPHLAAPPDEATLRRLRMGQEVDRQARQQFPNGRVIPYCPQPEDMVPLTRQAIAGGAETLFQATFATTDLLVKVDILTRTDTGWRLIEVKSSASYKPDEHLADVAFQLYVLRQAGVPVTQVSLMHINKAYRHPYLSDLFAMTDVTAEADAFLPQVAADIALMRQLMNQPNTPEVSIGRHCRKPNTCSFHDHCWQGITDLTIYDVPYLKRPKEEQLEAAGIRYVAGIPSDFALGDKRADALVKRIQQKQIAIDAVAIRAELAKLIYPLYFFDFETIDYAIPPFDGCAPYQKVPFQYSCHILTAGGELTHCDYLHTSAGDPRRALVESLLTHIGPTGHVVAYNADFEGVVLHNLAHQFPEYADQLRGIANRLWDQLAIFRQHYHHHGFGPSNSLKAVLPVIAPGMSYDTLDVQNGEVAQVRWEEMIEQTDTAAKARLYDQLRAYCHQDTLAMVEIHKALTTLHE